MDDLSLAARAGLPPALRVLVEEMPRLTWDRHPGFQGLAAFWLDRHLMFRRLTETLRQDAEARLDARIDPRDHIARLSRHGGLLVQALHGHHQIEDAEYFPRMAMMEPRIAAGFDLLDADHQSLDGLIADFVTAANAVITEGADAPGRFRDALLRFDRLLGRHLEDEEDLVVPVILKHAVE